MTEGNDRETVHRFLLLQMIWFRDALVLRHGGNVINIDQMDDLRRFVDRFGDADLHGAIAEVERAISLVGRNVYIKLVFLQLAVRLKSILKRPA